MTDDETLVRFARALRGRGLAVGTGAVADFGRAAGLAGDAYWAGRAARVAFLAVALGIPAVTGLGSRLLESVRDGDQLALAAGEPRCQPRPNVSRDVASQEPTSQTRWIGARLEPCRPA